MTKLTLEHPIRYTFFGWKFSESIQQINVKNFHGSLTTVVRAQNLKWHL